MSSRPRTGRCPSRHGNWPTRPRRPDWPARTTAWWSPDRRRTTFCRRRARPHRPPATPDTSPSMNRPSCPAHADRRSCSGADVGATIPVSSSAAAARSTADTVRAASHTPAGTAPSTDRRFLVAGGAHAGVLELTDPTPRPGQRGGPGGRGPPPRAGSPRAPSRSLLRQRRRRPGGDRQCPPARRRHSDADSILVGRPRPARRRQPAGGRRWRPTGGSGGGSRVPGAGASAVRGGEGGDSPSRSHAVPDRRAGWAGHGWG